eukprot:PITA_31965
MPFAWDEVSQKYFDDLKTALVNAPLLHPPNYYQDYLLYLASTPSTIAMILVQDDYEGNKHVIYYLSHNLLDTKTHYAHVEKLDSVVVQSLPAGADEQFPDETLFLTSTLDPWYGDIIAYLQTSTFRFKLTKDDRRRIRHHSQPYCIIGDTLYHVGVDSVLRRCLMIKEAERVLNYCHSRACGDHMSGYTTAQKILRTS